MIIIILKISIIIICKNTFLEFIFSFFILLFNIFFFSLIDFIHLVSLVLNLKKIPRFYTFLNTWQEQNSSQLRITDKFYQVHFLKGSLHFRKFSLYKSLVFCAKKHIMTHETTCLLMCEFFLFFHRSFKNPPPPTHPSTQ